MDKISVIVAVYNVEQFIVEYLESLQNQTYEHFEVLVIDDGSPDQSASLIKPFLEDSRFLYFKKKNGGLSSARNYGLEKATGTYVAFIDGDDYVDPDYLKVLHETITKENSGLAVCGFVREYSKKQTLGHVTYEDIRLFRCPAAWNKLYRLDVIRKNKLQFPVGLWYEDLHFTTRYILLNDFQFTPEILHHYRQNDQSIMHTYDDRIFQIYEVLHDIIEFAQTNHVYDKWERELEFLAIYHILVGTSFRASFHADFSPEMLDEIQKFVEEYFPNWYNNLYIKKNLGISYRMMLYLIRKNHFHLLYFMLKTFHRFVYL